MLHSFQRAVRRSFLGRRRETCQLEYRLRQVLRTRQGQPTHLLNPMKKLLAITALLLVAAPVQAQNASADQLDKSGEILKEALEASNRKDWKTACIKYKAYGAEMAKTGGFNYQTVSGSAAVQVIQRRINGQQLRLNNMHNKNGAGLCKLAGMEWEHRSMPTPPSNSQTSSVSSIIRNNCEREWGTDYSMVKYCIDKQTNAARSLGY